MSAPVKTRKKLIEVALPLDAINAASAHEKLPGIGAHPRSLHLWWARRPLAAARAVVFAQMVDDPSEYTDTLLQVDTTRAAANREQKRRKKLWEERPQDDRGPEPTLEECAADLERERLFRIVEDLVQWENTTNEFVLEKARTEIWQSWRRACADNAGHPSAAELFDRNKLPAFHDPFAGGGALPLEAQRLGLEPHASDLNPVAVLINKAMIEIPAEFTDVPPINPQADRHRHYRGVEGLSADIRLYGERVQALAEASLGRVYPSAIITDEMAADRPDLQKYVGRDLPVIAWLWARTVRSPNPAFRNKEVPLAATFNLCTKAGKEAWVEPLTSGTDYTFKVRRGKPKDARAVSAGTKLGRGANFQCLLSGATIDPEHVRAEAAAGHLGQKLIAIVAQGDRERVYLSPTAEQEAQAKAVTSPDWVPEGELVNDARAFTPTLYALKQWHQLFTRRQLLVLTSLCNSITTVRDEIVRTALEKWGEPEANRYADAVITYLAFSISRLADFGCTLATWKPSGEQAMHVFTRNALPMTWDFPESNFLGGVAICWRNAVKYAADALLAGEVKAPKKGHVTQESATDQQVSYGKIVSTDPPYYDNVPYADLSDFFYVWLRRVLRLAYPDLLSTMAVPKGAELVATPYRHGGRQSAEEFFLDGMTTAMHKLAEQRHPAFPTTIYYAFKQAESDESGTSSTGWETFLDAVVRAGFALSGTWPLRSEQEFRMRGMGFNALASSIVLVCRPRPENAPSATRREFLAALKAELPVALRHLQHGNIAPVDLAQAAIGPGMAVFTRFSSVIDSETGRAITVREGLARINEVLDEVLAAQEADFDPDTRWAVTWFDQFGFDEGDYGHAEQLSKAKNTAVAELADPRNGGIVTAKSGKVRLTRPADLPPDWDPAADPRLTVWEMVHHLIRRLDEGGEPAAAELVAELGVKAETARELAYRLYAICERKKRAADALAYNALVQSWPEISRLARDLVTSGATGPAQKELAI